MGGPAMTKLISRFGGGAFAIIFFIAFANFNDLAAQAVRARLTKQWDYAQKSGHLASHMDSPVCSGWTGPGDGGNFNGGRIFCTGNDGDWQAGPTWNNAVLELVSYDTNSLTGTLINEINRMTSMGAEDTGGCLGDSNYSFKSGGITAKTISGTQMLYDMVGCSHRSGGYQAVVAGPIGSPDHGAHWCRKGDLAGGGMANCNSSVWHADGAAPAVLSDFMWGTGVSDTANKFGAVRVIQPCQNFDTNCDAIPDGCDPLSGYVCFLGTNFGYSGYSLARCLGDFMIDANWSYWNGTAWVAGYTNAVVVITGYGTTYSTLVPTNTGTFPTPTWISGIGWVSTTNWPSGYVEGGDLGGIYRQTSLLSLPERLATIPSFAPPIAGYAATYFTANALPTFILGTLKVMPDSPKHFRIVRICGFNSSFQGYYHPYLQEVDFWVGVPAGGGTSLTTDTTGYTNIQFSDSLEPGALPRGNHVTNHYPFFDHMGNAKGWYWSGFTDYASPYGGYCYDNSGNLTFTSTGWSGNSGANCRLSGGLPAQFAGDHAWSVAFAWTTSTTSLAYQPILATASGGTLWGLYMNPAGNAGTASVIWNSGTGNYGVRTSSTVFTVNVPSVVVITKAAGTPSTSNVHIYVNCGASKALTTFGTLLAPTLASGLAGYWGIDTLGDTIGSQGQMHYALAWDVELTSREVVGGGSGNMSMGVCPVLKNLLAKRGVSVP